MMPLRTIHEYQRYLRADAEMALLTTPSKRAKSRDPKEYEQGMLMLLFSSGSSTLSHTDGPFTPPRKAAEFLSAQARFQGEGFEEAHYPLKRLRGFTSLSPTGHSPYLAGFVTARRKMGFSGVEHLLSSARWQRAVEDSAQTQKSAKQR